MGPFGLLASDQPNEAKHAGIVFQVHSITNASPGSVEQLVELIYKNPNFESKSVDSVNDLNRQNAFGKEDVNVGYRVAFQFFAGRGGQYTFELVYDAGIASCVRIDDRPMFFTDQDVWTGDENPVIKTVDLDKGWHSFEFLGLENCCGAPLRFSYKAPGQESTTVITPATLRIYGTTTPNAGKGG